MFQKLMPEASIADTDNDIEREYVKELDGRWNYFDYIYYLPINEVKIFFDHWSVLTLDADISLPDLFSTNKQV